MKKMRKPTSLIFAACMTVALLCSCNEESASSGGPASGADIAPSIASSAVSSTGASSALISAPPADTESVAPITRTNPPTTRSQTVATTQAQVNNAIGVQTADGFLIKVKDYGAKGDGKTDDYTAVTNALRAAQSLGRKVIVEFEANKTYLFSKQNAAKTAMSLLGAKDFTLRGNNTTISIENSYTFLNLNSCENVTVSGFNFKLSRLPYTLGDIQSVDKATKTAVIKTDNSLGITGSWYDLHGANFGLPYILDEGRLHMFITQVDVVDASKNTYKLYFNSDENIDNRLAMFEGANKPRFLMPVPDVGQVDSSAFGIMSNHNVTLQNINVWSASHFVFHMRFNTGTINITNVNLTPEPGTPKAMVSWRDGFHMKENRAKITFDHCRMEGSFDDVFNSSASQMIVNKVYSPTKFNMVCQEFGGTYPAELQVGDRLSMYNLQTGELVGETTITKVVEQNGSINCVEVADPLPKNRKEQVAVAVRSLAQPGLTINNCYVDGTVRFRNDLISNNTTYRLTYSWVENEPPYEGPYPQNLVFRNCTLKGLKDEFTFMSLGSVTTSGVQAQYASQVRFYDCDVNPARIYIRPGSDVQFVKNGQIYYQSN